MATHRLPHSAASVRAAAVLMVLAACKPVEEGPRDLSTALHDIWALYPEGADDELQAAVDDLSQVIDMEALAEGFLDGAQTRLESAELGVIEMEHDPDPTLATPLYTVTRFACTVAQLQAIIVHADQDSLYPGVYDSYERTFSTDEIAYLSGETHTVAWSSEIAATIFAAGSYEETIRAGARRIPVDPATWGQDAIILSRTWLPSPAVWSRENRSFAQDYQIEVFFPVGDDLVHTFGMWREMDLGGLGSSEDTAVQRLTVNNMAKWDDNTATLCAESRP